ncbi:MAG: Crp/Fnr family transcriptional regulator [Flavobacteriaceae bacterium]|jgi:CRP-like cAMP-binding protein|nr:Crp/Fnr family transcriptional regulator [Flavobacteriaceae bacterium]MBT3753435.1 Crp/Fnr family transcriptional regulator [Flavobacteriaceae bacterium]MBT4415347.1 Crp/Fnr family transcriptional regulator [Flavobacteriaceae bacterium]MBT5396572.1 Crp/Fnr family transcriptional regulator [Flavobacteriaceae bacterium]MBT5596711.1 Crp/Fnr family transcriptional regulator [Flavobacteriaceae bacterium]
MSKCESCIIRRLNQLNSLNKEEIIRISKCKKHIKINKGQKLFNEGENLKGIYCVQDGFGRLSKLCENGKEQIVRFIVKGSLIGQRSLISDEPTNLSATASEDMFVCFIPKEEIINDLMQNPKFNISMFKELADNLKNSDNFILDITNKPLKQRFSEALLYLQTIFGSDHDGMIDVSLNRSDYANFLGIRTESLIRVISTFKKNKIISTKGKKIKIENYNALKNLM